MSGDTFLVGKDTSNVEKPIRRDRDALFMSLYTLLAGELGAGTSDGQIRAIPSRKVTIIDVQTAVTIGAGGTADTFLFGIQVVKALTGTCVVTGFGNRAGNAVSSTLPVGFVGFDAWGDALNAVGPITITASNVADANNIKAIWCAAPAS